MAGRNRERGERHVLINALTSQRSPHAGEKDTNGPRFDSQHAQGSSGLFVTPIPVDLRPLLTFLVIRPFTQAKYPYT